LLGYSSEELYSRAIIDFIHPDDVQSTTKEIQKLSSGGLTVNFENRYRCKDGNFRTLNWNASFDKRTGLIYAAGGILSN
jgi:PAS domain S-box-containing protein